eukprot:5214666-Amphidinium_carterae.2
MLDVPFPDALLDLDLALLLAPATAKPTTQHYIHPAVEAHPMRPTSYGPPPPFLLTPTSSSARFSLSRRLPPTHGSYDGSWELMADGAIPPQSGGIHLACSPMKNRSNSKGSP